MKKEKTENTSITSKKPFFFPREERTVYASSREEAQKIMESQK